MRKIGIDFGSKKVGIALTDANGIMAFPHSVLKNDKMLLKNVCTIIEQEEVTEVVIGHSRNKDGNDNEIQTEIEAFITDLTLQLGIPVHLENEIYSTQEAMRIQGQNKKTDASAAAIILNSFLMKKNNYGNK